VQRIKGLWASLKYLFKFYYNGVKEIWKDRKIVADLRKTIAERESTSGEGVRWIEQAVITRHGADLRKLPLFLAILLILEEILPLLVIYAPSLLPSTCVLPSQSTKMRSGEEAKRSVAIQNLAKKETIRETVEKLAFRLEGKGRAAVGQEAEEDKEVMRVKSLSAHGSDTVREIARIFALSSWGPVGMISSRIEKHLLRLQPDDELLRYAYDSRNKSNQWREINESDWLWKACAQRGLRAFEASDHVMERNLIAYLQLTSRDLTLAHRSLLPLTLYDGTLQDLLRLQGEVKEEASKGIKRRTLEVVEEVTEAEKKKEVEKK
jgi:LETM1 and EF-hand domain-containing protein 1